MPVLSKVIETILTVDLVQAQHRCSSVVPISMKATNTDQYRLLHRVYACDRLEKYNDLVEEYAENVNAVLREPVLSV